MKRNIIKIDEDKCTGCGLCIPNCAEGSLEIRNGKAVLVKEALCDGLGACLGHCPEDALTLEVRDVEEFDEELVEERLKELAAKDKEGAVSAPPMGGCPGSMARAINPTPTPATGSVPSQLATWPVQLTLLNPSAPFIKGANLLLAADCTAFAYGDFHKDFIKDSVVTVACPKLDNAEAHYKKLSDVIRYGDPASITVVRMEVPCCGGIEMIAQKAIEDSGRELPVRTVVIGTDGNIRSDESN